MFATVQSYISGLFTAAPETPKSKLVAEQLSKAVSEFKKRLEPKFDLNFANNLFDDDTFNDIKSGLYHTVKFNYKSHKITCIYKPNKDQNDKRSFYFKAKVCNSVPLTYNSEDTRREFNSTFLNHNKFDFQFASKAHKLQKLYFRKYYNPLNKEEEFSNSLDTFLTKLEEAKKTYNKFAADTQGKNKSFQPETYVYSSEDYAKMPECLKATVLPSNAAASAGAETSDTSPFSEQYVIEAAEFQCLFDEISKKNPSSFTNVKHKTVAVLNITEGDANYSIVRNLATGKQKLSASIDYLSSGNTATTALHDFLYQDRGDVKVKTRPVGFGCIYDQTELRINKDMNESDLSAQIQDFVALTEKVTTSYNVSVKGMPAPVSTVIPVEDSANATELNASATEESVSAATGSDSGVNNLFNMTILPAMPEDTSTTKEISEASNV